LLEQIYLRVELIAVRVKSANRAEEDLSVDPNAPLAAITCTICFNCDASALFAGNTVWMGGMFLIAFANTWAS
jgi:hypothetical protein